MEEIRKGDAESGQPENGNEETAEDSTKLAAEKQKELREKIKQELEDQRKKTEEAMEALKQGKGKLQLDSPIRARDREITELIYDFTVMKGFEFTDAMDSDPNGANSFFITKRQALALFAKAAAKQTEDVDMQDIVSGLSMTDSVEAIEIATLFFNASRRAGRTRISRL